MNIESLKQGSVSAVSQLWTDYDGSEPYGDFTLNGDIVTHVRSFAPDLARTADPLGLSGLPTTDYYHTDMIGTTRMMTDPSGLPSEPAVYTAFGERISGSMTGPEARYGYAGAWGYQSHEEFPFLHVGARYYDPSTGRFLQRDPIGIDGGLNVYAYVDSAPTDNVDPSGLRRPLPPAPFGPPGARLPNEPLVRGRVPWYPPDTLPPVDPVDTMELSPLNAALALSCFVIAPPVPRSRPRNSQPYFCGVCPRSGTPHAHIENCRGRRGGHPAWHLGGAVALGILLYVLGWPATRRRPHSEDGLHPSSEQRK